MRRKRNNPAFTLIEMLVSLAMIVMVVSMVYGSYAATSESLQVYDSRLNCTQRAELALRLMARQVRCAYAPAEPNQVGPTDETRHKPPLIFLGDAQSGSSEILALLTTAGLAGSPTAPQRLTLTRYRYDRTARTLLISSGANSDATAEATWQLLLDRVESIDITFYDGRQWQPQWKYEHEQKLPRAAKIEIDVTAEDGRKYELATTVSIGCRVSTAGRRP